MPQEQGPPLFDLNEALDRVDDDRSLFTEIVAIFAEDHLLQLQRLRDAVQNRDSKGLEEAAHSIKGSVSMFAAPRLTEQAAAFERMGRDGTVAEAEPGLEDFESALSGLVHQLQTAAATLTDPPAPDA